MSENFLASTALLSPAAFAATAISSWIQPGFRPGLIKRMSFISAILSIVLVAWSGFFVFERGLLQSVLVGVNGLGFSIRLDSLSTLMLGLIALLGFIIVKFSNNYLDGDQHQGAFMGRLAATIASVQLLVLSGNLGLLFVSWILTSISLHRLLVFYPDRPGAQIAARKKYILARLGDLSLFFAFLLLYRGFGSGNLEVIFTAIKNSSSAHFPFIAVEAPALFLAIAALLKSAQFPTHGWLIEVMETPTPVSALLHAGLLNAGPFLIIRMAYVMDASTVAPILLMVVGGSTALFASVAYLTQTSIKTALGYSSVAHMGFSLMVCGLGAYPAAMLHLVAHSFYKAHAFLSSGSVIDLIRAAKVTRTSQSVSPLKVVSGIAMALTLYTGFALIWGIDPVNEFALLVVGAVIVLGLARLFTSALMVKSGALLLQTSLLALMVTVAFFTLESSARYLLANQVPALALPGWGKIIAAGIILLAFGLVVFIQIIAPQLTPNPYYCSLAIHVRNGFYANALFDRLVGALSVHTTTRSPEMNAFETANLPTAATEKKELQEQLV